MRTAIGEHRPKSRQRRSVVSRLRASILHPVFRQAWYSSINQRHVYHATRSQISSLVSVGTLVTNTHSTGSVTVAGGLLSHTRSTHAESAGRWGVRCGDTRLTGATATCIVAVRL